MSTAVAIPFAIGSAVVYGSSAVVQHRMAQQHARSDGRPSTAGLWRLLGSPIWLLAICGDAVGFVLQVTALANGPVVIVQPLVVLMLPVSLLVSAGLGWHMPRPGDYLGVLGVVGGLAVFLALVGQPAAEQVPGPLVLTAVVLVVLVLGAAACLAVRGRAGVVRAAVYGAAGGCYFGTLAVLVDALSRRTSQDGLQAFATARGIVPLAGIALLGMGGIALTQMSFQIGALRAALPANLAADPLTAVLFGELLLHERIPLAPGHFAGYVVCLFAVVGGTIRLAAPRADAPDAVASTA